MCVAHKQEYILKELKKPDTVVDTFKIYQVSYLAHIITAGASVKFIAHGKQCYSIRLATVGKADFYEESVSLFTLPEQQKLL